jgi:hypothetical protein
MKKCEVCTRSDVPIMQKLIIPRGELYRTDDDEIIEGKRVRSNMIDMCKDCNSLSRSIIWHARQREDRTEARRLMQRYYLIIRTRYENKDYIKSYIEEQQKDEALLFAQHMLSEAEDKGGDGETIERVRRYLWLSDMLHRASPSLKIEAKTYLSFDDYLEFELVRGERKRERES